MDEKTARPGVRLHCAAPLAAGEPVELGEARAHYLRNVMRMRAGDGIGLFNAAHGEWAARVESLSRSSCVAVPVAALRPPAAEDGPWLCFAPIKRARLDAMVEKATELGASRLVPVFTRHTAMERVNVERLAAIATEAAEQCERLSVPEISAPATLEGLLAGWPAGRVLVVADESGGGVPIASALAGASGPLAILAGPEGGFARAELDALARAVFVRRVGLGPRILRADTAAIAALAILQALAGDGTIAPRATWRDRDGIIHGA
ncbi:MAG: 16S rRNA (uracil(1498)-N(3))-methyltransferase [Alphaproteobacteria bacterium]|nr:16S rRNA (uracil(1498)-N(3))-methyltransferase [Alphaproteobacteria bacterium]